LKATLEMINGMQTEGVIGKYAIAGAVGATFYLEPSATADIDIFVMLPAPPGSSLQPCAYLQVFSGPRLSNGRGAHRRWGLASGVPGAS